MKTYGKRALLFVAAIAMGVALGQLTARATSSPGTTTAARPSDENTELTLLRARVGAVSRSVTQLRRSVDQSTVAPGPETDAPRPAVDAPPPPSSAAQATNLLRVLDGEPKDGDWSAAREDEINRALDADTFRAATVSSVKCGSTLCSMVLDFHDQESLRQVARAIPDDPAFSSGGFVHYTDDDSGLRAEVFLPRRGQELPLLE